MDHLKVLNDLLDSVHIRRPVQESIHQNLDLKYIQEALDFLKKRIHQDKTDVMIDMLDCLDQDVVDAVTFGIIQTWIDEPKRTVLELIDIITNDFLFYKNKIDKNL